MQPSARECAIHVVVGSGGTVTADCRIVEGGRPAGDEGGASSDPLAEGIDGGSRRAGVGRPASPFTVPPVPAGPAVAPPPSPALAAGALSAWLLEMESVALACLDFRWAPSCGLMERVPPAEL